MECVSCLGSNTGRNTSTDIRAGTGAVEAVYPLNNELHLATFKLNSPSPSHSKLIGRFPDVINVARFTCDLGANVYVVGTAGSRGNGRLFLFNADSSLSSRELSSPTGSNSSAVLDSIILDKKWLVVAWGGWVGHESGECLCIYEICDDGELKLKDTTPGRFVMLRRVVSTTEVTDPEANGHGNVGKSQSLLFIAISHCIRLFSFSTDQDCLVDCDVLEFDGQDRDLLSLASNDAENVIAVTGEKRLIVLCVNEECKITCMVDKVIDICFPRTICFDSTGNYVIIPSDRGEYLMTPILTSTSTDLDNNNDIDIDIDRVLIGPKEVVHFMLHIGDGMYLIGKCDSLQAVKWSNTNTDTDTNDATVYWRQPEYNHVSCSCVDVATYSDSLLTIASGDLCGGIVLSGVNSSTSEPHDDGDGEEIKTCPCPYLSRRMKIAGESLRSILFVPVNSTATALSRSIEKDLFQNTQYDHDMMPSRYLVAGTLNGKLYAIEVLADENENEDENDYATHLIHDFGSGVSVNSLVLADDCCSYILCGDDDGMVSVFRFLIENGEPNFELVFQWQNAVSQSEADHVEVWSVACSMGKGNALKVAVACENRTLTVWRIDIENWKATKIVVLKDHVEAVTSVIWTTNLNQQSLLISSSDDRRIHVYIYDDNDKFAKIASLCTDDAHFQITYISANSSGILIASTMRGMLYAFDLNTMRKIDARKVHCGSVEGISKCCDGLIRRRRRNCGSKRRGKEDKSYLIL